MNPEGDVMARLYFMGGVPQGEGTIFYPRKHAGKLSKRGWFLKTPTNVKESYVALVSCPWIDGLPYGEQVSINFDNGQPWYHGSLESGVRTGIALIYFHKRVGTTVCGIGGCCGGNNKPKEFRYKGNFADGKKNGHGILYDKSNNIIIDGMFVDGKCARKDKRVSNISL